MSDGSRARIEVLVPDMPLADALVPYMRRIDSARWYSNFGPLVRSFEATLASSFARMGPALESQPATVEVVSVSSGTAALELAIDGLRIAKGTQALVPAHSFAATANAVHRRGLEPVFCDVDGACWQLTPALAREACSRTRIGLVLPVATFGCPVDAAEWDRFVDETGVPVLIDAAAAFGHQAIGANASVAFSFHATKPFGIGEGGMLVTRCPELARRVRRLSNAGYDDFRVEEPGTNGKLSEYAAAVGLAQWERWPSRRQWRRELFGPYSEQLRSIGPVALQAGVSTEVLPAVLAVKLPATASLVAASLAKTGIQTRRWYSPPLTDHPAYATAARLGPGGTADLPVTNDLSQHLLGIPWHAHLRPEDCRDVVTALARAVDDCSKL